MNILFVNYGDFTTNSLNHIGGFANTLAAQGHSCVVAVPSAKETLASVPSAAFTAALYDEVLAQPAIFPNRGLADVIHAWTPRECVRKFVLAYQRTAKRAARLVVHLEDNEDNLISAYAQLSREELGRLGFGELDELMSDSLPHPFRHKTFLRLADEATLIVEKLDECVPPTVPFTLLPPGVAPEYLQAIRPDPGLRGSLGIAPGEKLVVFTGSNTFANEPDMRELYLAIRILNQRGTPTRLVRTGFGRPEFQESLTPELKVHVLDLGFIAKERLPALLAIADVLVQPGRPGPFNDYRLPSKVPEFLASGRPVVLPPTNIALAMRDGQDAFFLESGSPENIADCCTRIFNDPALAAHLGKHGAAFARRHFDLQANSAELLKIYERVLARPARACWELIREASVSDLAAAAAEVAAALNADVPGDARVSADIAGLAEDLAAIVRLEDERECGAIEVREKVRVRLEEQVRHLETQRDLTRQHAQNLEEKVQAQDRHALLQKKLSDRHIQNLEARIISIEAMMRTEAYKANEVRSRLDSDLSAASAEHGRLVARILEMESELIAREKRLKATFRSLSWRLTAPLRDIERFLRGLGRGQKAAPVVVAPPAASPQASAPSLPVAAAPAAPVPATHSYTFNFDHPRTWTTASNKLLILGWCYENAAEPILGIRAIFDEKTYLGIYGSKRLDVLASTGMKQAAYSGIKIEVPTVLGDHLLVVEVQHADGWHPYFHTLVHVGKAGDPAQLSDYEKWCEQHEALGDEDLAAIGNHIAAFRSRPVISVIMPVYNTPAELLEKAVGSVTAQLYPYWQLCIADDASSEPQVREVLTRLSQKEPRIKVTYRPVNGHICEASNSALELATGDYVALFDHDDVLAPTALYEVAAELDAHPDAQFIYSDEDKIDMEDRRCDPYFKPDWNPDLFYGQNYTSHLSVYKADLIRSLGGFRKGYEGSQDWDLNLRAIERIPATAIRHIPKLLYHWRAAPGSTALQLAEKSYPVDAAKRALEDHFGRLRAAVEIHPVPGDHWRIKHPVPSPSPLVSLIIPTRNSLRLVRMAVESILKVTDYPNFEIIIVDNDSDDPETLAWLNGFAAGANPRVRVMRHRGKFNYSAINNAAVGESPGELVGFLNSDVEAIEPGWLKEMVSQASRPGIGAVGAMLYYPVNTVQHAGVILGLGGVAGHPFKDFPRGDSGQKNRLRLVQNYSAVTAACLVIRKDRFLEVGGFNETQLAIAFNDVDLCCKLVAAGYRNVWTPFAELYHHESATRGADDTQEKRARFQAEIDYMMNRWGSFLMADPNYNPNLTLVGEDFSPAYLSRAQKAWMAHLP